jgi:hypothetical protein
MELTQSESELINALEEAILCIQWLRQFRTDAQGDEGIPSEAIWLDVIAKAKGREERSLEDFLLLCSLALCRKLDREAIAKATTP